MAMRSRKVLTPSPIIATMSYFVYLKRDIANIALGNKDKHGRNTAIQRGHDGTISLTPLFDFAPMWLHPDGIARRVRWQSDDAGSPNWASAIDQACEAAQLNHAAVTTSVRTMLAPLATLFADARALGIDVQFLTPLEKNGRECSLAAGETGNGQTI